MPKRTKNESSQKQAMRERMKDYLKENDVKIKDGSDVNSVMRDRMSVLLEGALDEELDEELGNPIHLFPVSSSCQASNLHDQCD